ncbi:MAG: hypothetical protein ABW040_04595 [Microbacteriaceae bacterium]
MTIPTPDPADPGSTPPPHPEAGAPQRPTPPPGAPPHPQYAPAAAPRPRAPYATLRIILHIVVPVATVIGLTIPRSGDFLWFDNPLWSLTAFAAAIVQLVPAFGSAGASNASTLWTVGAVAVATLLLYWVLVALPSVANTNGFFLTVAVGAAVGASWLSPGRRL